MACRSPCNRPSYLQYERKGTYLQVPPGKTDQRDGVGLAILDKLVRRREPTRAPGMHPGPESALYRSTKKLFLGVQDVKTEKTRC